MKRKLRRWTSTVDTRCYISRNKRRYQRKTVVEYLTCCTEDEVLSTPREPPVIPDAQHAADDSLNPLPPPVIPDAQHAADDSLNHLPPPVIPDAQHAADDSLNPLPPPEIQEQHARHADDPYTLFSTPLSEIPEQHARHADDPYTFFSTPDEKKGEDSDSVNQNPLNMGNNKPGNSSKQPNCSISVICADESTPKKSVSSKSTDYSNPKKPIPRSISSPYESDIEIQPVTKREWKNKTEEIQKTSSEIKKKKDEIKKLTEVLMETNRKLTERETELGIQITNSFQIQKEKNNLQEKTKKLEEEKAELQVKLDAKIASLIQYEDLVNHLKVKEAESENTKIDYHNLQKKNRRLQTKVDRFEIIQKRLKRRISYTRRMNKQSLNMLEDMKDICDEESLPPKKMKMLNSLIANLKKSLTIEANE